MSLAPGERQALAEIESRLRWSDPRLAAMLALWRVKGAWTRVASMFLQQRPGPGDLMRFLVVAAGLALAIGVAIAGVLMTIPARPPGHGRRPAGAAISGSAYRAVYPPATGKAISA